MLKRTGCTSYNGPIFADGVMHERLWADSRQPYRLPEWQVPELIRVLSGVVGLYGMDARGSRQFVALRFPGEIIAPASLGRFGIWPLIRSELAVARSGHADAIDLSGQFTRDMAIAYEWLAQSRTGAAARLAHLLCEIATRGAFGTERMPHMLTQAQLADITGQTSVNVNRVFADLESQGLIARDGGEIIFKNWPGLCRLASFDPAYLEAA